CFRQHALHFVAISLALRGAGEIEQAGVPARYLHALVAMARGPAGDVGEIVKRCRVAGELREENSGPLHGLHDQSPVSRMGLKAPPRHLTSLRPGTSPAISNSSRWRNLRYDRSACAMAPMMTTAEAAPGSS